MRSVWNFLRRHFAAHSARSPLAFAFWMGLEGLIVSLLLAIVVAMTVGASRPDITNLTYMGALLLLVLVAPLVETVVFQMLPIAAARWYRASIAWQVVASTLLFAAAHFPSGIASGVCAGVIGGFYFAFGYAHWAARSHWTAYWTTTFQHSMRNGVVFGLAAAAGGFISPDAMVDSNVILGAPCGIRVWYFTSRGDDAVQFALVFSASQNDGRRMTGVPMDGFIRRNFQLEFAGRLRDIVYKANSNSLTVDEHTFDLTQGNTIIFSIDGDQYTTRQLQIAFDAERVRNEPFSVGDSICNAMTPVEETTPPTDPDNQPTE